MSDSKNGDEGDREINNELEKSSEDALEEELPEEVSKVIEELPDDELKVKLKAAFALSIKSTHYRGTYS